jgi:hypothetical protein
MHYAVFSIMLRRVCGAQEERLGLRPRFEGNELTRWGTRMEPHGLAAYTMLTGRSVDSADIGVRY